MSTEQAERLVRLASHLQETLMTAVICTNELYSTILAEFGGSNGELPTRKQETQSQHRPLLDQSTFSVVWRGKSLRLGHTRQFWVLHRLARCPNQYVTHLDLLQDVWESDELTTATIRSVVRHLRSRLRHGDMTDLAEAILGHQGHYVLRL